MSAIGLARSCLELLQLAHSGTAGSGREPPVRFLAADAGKRTLSRSRPVGSKTTHCGHRQSGAFLSPMFRAVFPILCQLALSGCTYSYDVQAEVSKGRLTFNANPQWGADCLRRVDVRSDMDGGRAVWEQSISHDDHCENRFPITYGEPLRGRPDASNSDGDPDVMIGTLASSVTAEKLRVGVIYTISTTTGTTGYGCGRFRIEPNGHVQNLGCS